jgi:hypothetical protein
MNGTAAANVEVNVALWVVSAGVGLVFAASGAIKLVVTKKRLALRGSSWIDDFSSGTVVFVGVTEIIDGVSVLVSG